jgi:hypothetical protein
MRNIPSLILWVLLLFGVGRAFVAAQTAHGQKVIPQLTDAASISKAAVGDTLLKQGTTLITKAPNGKLSAKVYSEPQWSSIDVNAEGVVKAGGYAITYIPDEATAKLDVRREADSTKVKEFWTVPDNKTTKLSWIVKTDAKVTWDDKGKVLSFSNGATVQPPIAWDADKKPVDIDVKFENMILTYTIKDGAYKYPLIVDPTTVVINQTHAGFTNASSGVYTGVRDSTTSSYAYDNIPMVGQSLVGEIYTVYRAFFSFPIPAGLATVDACSLYVYGDDNQSVTDFNIIITGANAVRPVISKADFVRFDGHTSSGAYTGMHRLNIPWNSASYSAGWNKLIFNTVGLDSIKNASGDTLWVAMISHKDSASTAPSNSEYVRWNKLTNSPYISITYESSAPATPPIVTASAVSAVTGTTLTFNGAVSDSGGATVDSVRVRFRTGAFSDSIMTVENTAVGLDAFTIDITGRIIGATYTYELAGRNEAGWGDYTETLSVTMDNVPTVTNVGVAVSGDSVRVYGTITSLNGADADSIGVIAKVGSTPAVTDSTWSEARAISAADTFSVWVKYVGPGVHYHYELWASNAVGRGYGSEGHWPVTPATQSRQGMFSGGTRGTKSSVRDALTRVY